MVAFNSDWCPACLKMENRWNYFGDWCKDQDIAVGKVDIGASPILTGKVIIEKSRSEGSLMEQDTIENVS